MDSMVSVLRLVRLQRLVSMEEELVGGPAYSSFLRYHPCSAD